MTHNFVPILVVPAVPHKGGIRFLHRKEQIDIGPEMADEVWKILEYCNGHNDIKAIAKFSSVPINDVREIIEIFADLELIVDSRKQYLHFQRIYHNPASFTYALTQDKIKAYTNSPRRDVKKGENISFKVNGDTFFANVLPKRRSCRNFTDKKLTLEQIGNICHYAYFIKSHTVPSGGALYPLKIYVLIEQYQDGINPGYYEYDAEQDCLVLFSSEVDEEQLKYCFNQEEMPFGSSVQIIIAADLERQTQKYANRGYVLTLIEAGHVAENISLFCAEQGLGACEMGGIQEDALRQELNLEEEVAPIIAIPVGYPSEKNSRLVDKTSFIENHLGPGKLIEEKKIETFAKNGSFFSATTKHIDEDSNAQYAGGTSTNDVDALFKATIEAYERQMCSKDRCDYFGKAEELVYFLDPRSIVPLTQKQAKLCGTPMFHEKLPIAWVIGKDTRGDDIYVPADIVYYGHRSKGNQIYFANSSGVAAYTNFQEAQKRAIVELIERDALMRSWYSRQSPSILGETVLPIHAKKRIKHWHQQGHQMKILQLPSQYGWVFEVIIVSKAYPCFVSGAAATIEESMMHRAIYKAIQEAESQLASYLQNPNRRYIKP